MSTTTATDPHVVRGVSETTETAKQNRVLTPRFYTTDFDAMNRIDVEPVREEWDALVQEFRDDSNSNHFERDEAFADEVNTNLPPALKKEFIDFMVSSVTAEFSGCVLYADIKKRATNADIRELMGYMARDESRHAGFINRALKDFGMEVDLGHLRRAKKYTFFKPKFIFYATYLSEKIGYARYITIFRHLEKHPEKRFHPIFRWFEQWCNDEFRHGEVFALFMRADPKLLEGRNRLWIRFFLNAVFATMYVRDHDRPEMHAAFGMDPTEYDYEVFRITSECTRQVFPMTLDLDNPKFHRALERLRRITVATERAREQGGVIGAVKRAGLAVAACVGFARLYMVPTVPNELPAKVLTQPTW